MAVHCQHRTCDAFRQRDEAGAERRPVQAIGAQIISGAPSARSSARESAADGAVICSHRPCDAGQCTHLRCAQDVAQAFQSSSSSAAIY